MWDRDSLALKLTSDIEDRSDCFEELDKDLSNPDPDFMDINSFFQ